MGLPFRDHFGESTPDIGIRVPRLPPVDIAAVIVEVTGVDEVTIGSALLRNVHPCHTRFVRFSAETYTHRHRQQRKSRGRARSFLIEHSASSDHVATTALEP